jgi:predicted DNA binding CopG/RHH family protein/DNA-binding Xre family transcriptional regulator
VTKFALVSDEETQNRIPQSATASVLSFGESASIAFDWSRQSRILPSAARRAEALHPLTFFENESLIAVGNWQRNFKTTKEYRLLKDRKMSIRISEENLALIHQKATKAKLNFTDYVTRACLGKQIVIIDGLDEILKEQKAIGRNLNQLTLLANMGRVEAVNLTALTKRYAELNATLTELLERKRWSDGNG